MNNYRIYEIPEVSKDQKLAKYGITIFKMCAHYINN